MDRLRFSELHCREVINLCDGQRLGEVSDLLIDPVSGHVVALVLPGQSGLLSLLTRREEIVLPWSCIETLGDDYILVRFSNKNI